MAGDPHWSKVALLLHMDGSNGSTTFTDSKAGSAWTATGATISTAQAAPLTGNTASAVLSGAGQYVKSTSGTTYALAAGDFTIEAQVRFTALPTAGNAFSVIYKYNGSTACFGLRVVNTAGVYTLQLTLSANGSTMVTSSATFSPSINTWYAVAASRVSGTVYLSVDGTTTNAGTNSTSVIGSSVETYVGTKFSVGEYFNGHIDELRITIGKGRYTANYTPTSDPFPEIPARISGTVKDSSDALVARAVHVHRRVDGVLSGIATSNATTGVFSIDALDDTAHYAVALPVSSAENAIILDNLIAV